MGRKIKWEIDEKEKWKQVRNEIKWEMKSNEKQNAMGSKIEG